MRHFFTIMKTSQIYQLFKASAGIATDSRNIARGQIFFALKGDNFNGNKFAAQALAKGASWVVIDDPQFETAGTILVDDCLAELQDLASYHRKEMNIPVLAITGTNGKTTTKELLAAVLSRKYRIHYTKGNLNNHIGVPLTILSAPADTEMMIIEMGANHQGEIKTLCLIAQPDFGIITNIGTAHIEGFGSFEGVVKTKTELYEHLRMVNGTALFNDEDPILRDKVSRYVSRAFPYSAPAGIPLVLRKHPSELNLVLKVDYDHETFTIKSNLFGSYNFWNIKAAIAAGLFFKVKMADITQAVEQYQPSNNRSQVKVTGRNTLICDSYNANPSSMHSALESFAALEGNPKLVILGDMLELGNRSVEEHTKILSELKSLKIENVMLAGRIFQEMAAGTRFSSFPDVIALADFLKSQPVNGHTILIKGSRGIGLEKIYELL